MQAAENSDNIAGQTRIWVVNACAFRGIKNLGIKLLRDCT